MRKNIPCLYVGASLQVQSCCCPPRPRLLCPFEHVRGGARGGAPIHTGDGASDGAESVPETQPHMEPRLCGRDRSETDELVVGDARTESTTRSILGVSPQPDTVAI